MRLVAIRPLTYAGQSLRPGDRFEAPDLDARILRDGHDPKVIDDPLDEKREVAMSTMTAVPIVPERQGRYRRRDMRAERA